MKTSELTGPALDWAVAKCEGFENLRRNPHRFAQHLIMNRAGTIKNLGELNYHSDWSQGGPIIEREKISLRPDYWNNGGCRAFIDRGGSTKNIIGSMHGPTPLVAAMRCYCASKLGDEVEIPEELK